MAQIITAVTGLLWPLLALLVLLVFRGPVTRVIASAERREFTLKVGGQELDMKQLTDQQTTLITDLQNQISRLRAELAQLTATPAELTAVPRVGSPAGPTDLSGPPRDFASAPAGSGSGTTRRRLRLSSTAVPATPPAAAVLWVDDRPENNALVAELLERGGLRVDRAPSTAAALRELAARRYGAVLSDMSRIEDGHDVSDAGLRLCEAMRGRGIETPFIVYAGRPPTEADRDRGDRAGVTAMTQSPSLLLETLTRLGLLPVDPPVAR